mgnify:CR=1 FL=1
MMTDDIITGKASIKGREDVENVVCRKEGFRRQGENHAQNQNQQRQAQLSLVQQPCKQIKFFLHNSGHSFAVQVYDLIS